MPQGRIAAACVSRAHSSVPPITEKIVGSIRLVLQEQIVEVVKVIPMELVQDHIAEQIVQIQEQTVDCDDTVLFVKAACVSLWRVPKLQAVSARSLKTPDGQQ